MAENTPVPDSFKKSDEIEVIGLPPSYVFEPDTSDGDDGTFVKTTLPIMALYPAYPALPEGERAGLQLFNLDYETGLKKYSEILQSVNVEWDTSKRCLYVAFQNDASITESFSSGCACGFFLGVKLNSWKYPSVPFGAKPISSNLLAIYSAAFLAPSDPVSRPSRRSLAR